MRHHSPTRINVLAAWLPCGLVTRVADALRWLRYLLAVSLWGVPVMAQPTATSFAPNGTGISGRRLAHYQHTRWSVADGLPISGVRSIRRSADGYLWLGTTDALVRFDGLRFVVIDSSMESALRSSVPGTFEPLLLDTRGALWISRPDGALLHYRNGRFSIARAPDSTRGRVSMLTRDGMGRLWAMASRPFVIDSAGTAHDVTLPPGVRIVDVQGMAADTGTGVWMGTRRGELWHISADGRSTREPIDYSGDGGVRPLLQSRDGALWMLNRGAEYLLNRRWWPVRSPQSASGAVNAVRAAELPDGSVLLASRGYGLIRLHHGVVDEFIEKDGLSDAVTRGLFVDVDGTIWISTDGGLDRLRRTLFMGIGRRDGLGMETPSLLHADGTGALWLKDFGYPSIFRVALRSSPRGLGPPQVTEVRPPAGARLLPMGARRGDGVWAIVGRSRLVVVRPTGISNLPLQNWTDHVPRRVVEARDGTLWIGFNNEGGAFGRVHNGRYAPFVAAELQPSSLAVHLVEDSLGGIWLQSARPAVLFHVVDGVTTARHRLSGNQSLSDIKVEGGDTLWAIQGSGLVRFIGDRQTTVSIPSAAPILRGEAAALHATRGWLWVASAGGIGRLPLAALHRVADNRGTPPSIEVLGVGDGLPTQGLSASGVQSTALDREGRLWVATPAGLAVADLREPTIEHESPHTIIESVEVDGRVLNADERLVLPPRPDRVVFRFTATAPNVPERVRVQFRMDGVDTSWQEVSGPRQSTYTQLRHGRYTFRVRSWLEHRSEPVEAQLSLRVPPAWFESLWFALLLASSLVGAGVGVTHLVARARARRTSERQRVRFETELGERNRLARELHDTLLQGFTGITLQLQAVQSQLPATAVEASESLERILELADQSIREARSTVWDMRAPTLEQFDLVSALEADGRATLGECGASFTVCCTGTPRRLADHIETAMLRIGREALANARRHACATRIMLRLDYRESQLVLTIDDDGRGLASASFDPSPDGGWGVRGMQERAQQIGALFTIGRSPEGGTRVEVTVPDTSMTSPVPPETP
jgi:signal transduction histidine kinase/ligand-binding sensor domain-containing protein